MEKRNIIALVVVLVVVAAAVVVYYNSTISGSAITTTCIDTDSGLNYEIKGMVLYGDNIFEDECRTVDYLAEYQCKKNIYSGLYHPAMQLHRCEDSCVEGACITG